MRDKNIFDSVVFRTNLIPEQPFAKLVLIYGSQALTNNPYPWTCKDILRSNYLIKHGKTKYVTLPNFAEHSITGVRED